MVREVGIKGIKVKVPANGVMTIEQARNVKLVLDRLFSKTPASMVATERRKGVEHQQIGTYDQESGVFIITP